MHKRLPFVVAVLALLACAASPALAQSGSASRPTSGSDRLFLAFAEDATVVDGQWWEVQFAAEDEVYDAVDSKLIRGVMAFQPWIDFEVGGRVGFGDTDGPGPALDGSGATDLDLWGKYHLGQLEETEFAVGGVITVPTGDETAGLGSDAFAASVFGAVRHRLDKAILAAHAGLQLNGDGRRFGATSDRDGETAPAVGAGVIAPFSDNLTGVGEIVFRDGRLDGDDDDTRALVGLNWRPGGRGIFRAAVAFGLSDDAPDFQALIGYAGQF